MTLDCNERVEQVELYTHYTDCTNRHAGQGSVSERERKFNYPAGCVHCAF